MGCDIHVTVEKKIDGQWVAVWPRLVQSVDELRDHKLSKAELQKEVALLKSFGAHVTEQFDYHFWEKRRHDFNPINGLDAYMDTYIRLCDGNSNDYGHALDGGRMYGTFAILAGVRNYEAVTPIAAPRGMPVDASPQAKYSSDQMDVDGHSHSYHTLTQLLAFDWDQKNKSGEKYKDQANWFYTKTIPALQALAHDCSTDDVRYVFFFDN